MAVYPQKLAHEAVLAGLRSAGYAAEGVMVYYRLRGTDQVVYADTGRIAPGQALESSPLLTPHSSQKENMDTVVLMHPQSGQIESAQAALKSLGDAQILFEEMAVVAGRESGETPEGAG